MFKWYFEYHNNSLNKYLNISKLEKQSECKPLAGWHLDIRFAVCHFLLVVLWNWVCIYSCFSDNGFQTYWQTTLTLGSRDVLDHVTIRFTMLMVQWNQTFDSSCFRDIRPQLTTLWLMMNELRNATNEHESQYLLAGVIIPFIH